MKRGRYFISVYPPSPIFRLISRFFPQNDFSGLLSPALGQDAGPPLLLRLFSGVARAQLRANHSQNHFSVPMTWTWLNKLQWQAQKYSPNQLGRNLGPKQETSHKGQQQSGDNLSSTRTGNSHYKQGAEFSKPAWWWWTAVWNK